MMQMVMISGVSSVPKRQQTQSTARKGEAESLTFGSISALENLPGNHPRKVGPAVDAQHDAPCPFPRRVPRHPDREQRPAHEDAGHADVREAIAQLVAVRGSHDDAANDAQRHPEDDVVRSLSEVVAGVHHAQETGSSASAIRTVLTW